MLLEVDLANDVLFEALKETPDLVGSWKSTKKYHPELAKDHEVLNGVNQVTGNPNVITIEDIVKIQGYGVNTTKAGFLEILNDVNKMANTLKTNNTTVINLQSVINQLHQIGSTAIKGKRGFHFVIKDLGIDVKTFKDKLIKLEHSTKTIRKDKSGNPTTAFIDVFCKDCVPQNLKIEYKSGPGGITSKKIKTQFIQRDLFSATNLDEIQWRMEGTGLTPEKLKKMLIDNKQFIEELGKQQISLLLKYSDIMNMSKSQAADVLIDFLTNQTNYKNIFK